MDEHTSPAVFMGGCLSFAEYGLLKGLIWKIVIIFYNILVETATKLSYYHSTIMLNLPLSGPHGHPCCLFGLPAVYGHYENDRIDSVRVLGAKRFVMEKNVKADKKRKIICLVLH